MACASVAHKKGRLSREIGSIKVSRPEHASPSGSSNGANSNGSISGRNRYLRNPFDRGEVHEAVKFLQEEHEKILSGLHKQIEALQHRCDDIHFESHLRHVLTNEEEVLRTKLKDMTKKMEAKTKQAEELEQMVEQGKKQAEEERQQHRWREVQLEQQIEVNEQRSTELKSEISRLKAQVHDLQVYCSGIRASGGGSRASNRPSQGRSAASSPRSTMMAANGPLRSSQESLDSFGPRSLGSEDGDLNAWREARLGGSMNGRFIPSRTSRVMSSTSYTLVGNNLNQSQTSLNMSLPPLTPTSGSFSRPTSGSVMLPPISQSQVITRPQVRKQLRLFSAPNLDTNANIKSKSSKQPP